jgi:ribonucleoside-triphosphate reductase
MAKLLTRTFLDQYPAQPEHMNELGIFTAYRTYTRWLDKEQRRETWKEAVARAVEYSTEQDAIRRKELGYPFNPEAIRAEAEALFDNIFNLRQFLSGRTHWVGGANTKVAEKFPLANFNCSFIEVTKWSDLAELFYLLLVGTGVGFKATKEGVKALGSIRTDVNLVHAPYEPIVKELRIENTQLNLLDNGFAKIYVGDSKEGWVDALKLVLTILTSEHYNPVHTIKISYNSIRPKGEKLQTFGGTASGHESLKEMFDGIWNVIRGEFDPLIAPAEIVSEGRVQLRPIHILDIGNLIGYNVVVGGVRRTAEIFLADEDDFEVILAKYGVNGIWNEANHNKVIGMLDGIGQTEWAQKLEAMELNNPTARPIFSRRMSNNSVAFTSKPTREMLHLIFTIMQGEGEPGFVNLESANKRRPNAKGLNPCAEILLDSYGVCNLTTVNVRAFVNEVKVEEEDGSITSEHILDLNGLLKAQALSARAGLRMTLLDLEIPHWNAVHKRDRLTGTSLTGWYDAMDLLGYDQERQKAILQLLEEVATEETREYATSLRIPLPLLITTIKPEGTLSQVAGGVSSGLHRSHSAYYKRRIRINANDALVDVAKSLGWTIHAEVGTAGFNNEESLSKPEVIAKANTLVITFPVASGARITKDDITVDEQFDTYFMFQDFYTQHNSSNTITVKPDEWERAEERVWESWDNFIGVSFLAHDGGNYTLAPYEACTEEEYNALKESMGSFDVELLHKFERGELSEELDNTMDCSTGACPIR